MTRPDLHALICELGARSFTPTYTVAARATGIHIGDPIVERTPGGAHTHDPQGIDALRGCRTKIVAVLKRRDWHIASASMSTLAAALAKSGHHATPELRRELP